MPVSIHLPVANLATTDQYCFSLGQKKLPPLSNAARSTYELDQGARIVAHSMADFSTTLREGDQPDRPSGARQMYVSIEVGSAQAVNDFVAAAVAGGGEMYRPPLESSRGQFTGAVKDPDGHVWEACYTDDSLLPDVPWT
jgi:predicted lactoylglutathione lyase